MFIAALFKIGKKWKHSKCPSTGERIHKSGIHTMEYYLDIKRNKLWVHASTWMNLENVMVSERN